jgi:drug/metabolite transporter (DMT)-like permease
MTLIGIWGPTVASVANLLTIALVGIADAIWMGSTPSIIKVGGAGLICAGFAVLLWEGDEA